MDKESDRKWLMETVRRADAGDRAAMEVLNGISGRRIEEIGTRSMDRLASEGSSWALILLGRIFEQRGQTEDDLFLAMRLYEDAAEKRNPYAMVALAKIFERGDCIVKSFHNAYLQYERAASLRCPEAIEWMAKNGEKGRC